MRSPIGNAVVGLLTIALGFAPAARAQTIDEVCTDEMELGACFDAIRDAIVGERRSATTEAAMASKSELLSSETSSGAAGSAWDTLSQLFGALGLGTSERTEDALTLQFNTDALWDVANPVSARVVLHDARLFAPALEAQEESARADFREAFENELGDFDDVEVLLAWSRSRRNEALQRDAVFDLVGEIYAAAAEQSMGADGGWPEFLQKLRDATLARLRDAEPAVHQELEDREFADLPIQQIREHAESAGLGEELERRLIDQANDSAERFVAYLQGFPSEDGELFLKLASGEPQFRIALSVRERAELAGPAERKASVTWERSAYSLSRATKACPRGTADFARCWLSFQRENDESIRRAARFSLSAEYAKTEHYDLDRDGWAPVHLDSAESVSAVLAYGMNLRSDPETRAVALRFDLEAKYEDVSGDPNRNNRFVATATLAQALTGGAHASLTLVYANRPEYRGTVDEELSARAGLKWTMDRR